MIKANELRIGNLVHAVRKDYSSGENVDVVEAVENIFNGMINPDLMQGEMFEGALDFKAIDITKEWLLKFGFYETQDGCFTKRIELLFYGGFTFRMTRHEPTWKFWYGDDFIQYVNHVHKLQNLYYAIMGGREL